MARLSVRMVMMAVVAMCVAQQAHAHMYLSGIVPAGGTENTASVWPHPTDGTGDSPVSDKTSQRFDKTTDMICGLPSNPFRMGSATVTLAAGTSVALQWWHATPGDDVVDGSHRGPCSVWMAAKATNGVGKVWFKIYEEGYNAATGLFCTDRIRQDGANKGKLFATIPADIAPGAYLLRGETWALHEGYADFGAQPYVGCADVVVTGTGTAVPTQLTNIVGLFQPKDPSLLFNIYNGFTSYPIPVAGVPVYKANAATAPTAAPTAKPTVKPTASPTGNSVCTAGTVGCNCATGDICNVDLMCSAGMCINSDALNGDANVLSATLLVSLVGSLVAVL